MKPIEDFKNKIIEGDCMEIMKEMPDNSIDTIITDPPYGLEFMGKDWDKFKENKNFQEWNYLWAKEALRVAKPGTILMAFGGTRTWHRLACAIEDAGWEIFDCIFWIYASGFPKSLNIGQAIDKDACKKQLTEKLGRKPTKEEFKKEWEGFRRVVGKGKSDKTAIWQECGGMGNFNLTKPTTPEAKQWEGYGTALKPAVEPIVVARKPIEGTYAENALKWGVAGLNIDESRIEFENTPNPATNPKYRLEAGYKLPTRGQESKTEIKFRSSLNETNIKGRFPANLLLDEEAAKMLDEQSGNKCGQLAPTKGNEPSTLKRGNVYGDYSGYGKESQPKDKLGGASRFFYVAKASRAERNMGCEGAYILKENTPEKIKKEIEKYLTTIKTDDILKE